MARILALAAAALCGASGLALQVQLATCAALPLGHGAGPALALTVFLSAWALGAWLAGRLRARPSIPLFLCGALLALGAPLATLGVVRAAPLLALPAIAIVAIAVVALLQGAFLPLLARAQPERSVALLVAANLLGAWAGAGWIADDVVASGGRVVAAFVAGACALLAGAAGFVATLRYRAPPGLGPAATTIPADLPPTLGSIGRGSAAVVIGLSTAWMTAVEWSLVRLGALWFGGMQDALTAVLTASLGALALGAALLPPILPRGARGIAVALALCALASLWPLGVHVALEQIASRSLAVRALALCVPALLPFGAIVPLVHRALAGESGRRLGDLYVHESWGALLGIPVVQLVLGPRIGLAGGLAVVGGLGLLAALALLPRARIAAGLAAAMAVASTLLLASAHPPALRAPALSNPAFTIRSFAEDRDFAVTVVDDGLIGERTLLTDGFRAAGTGRDYRYMRALGHLPLLLHPNPRRVAVLALGTGTTVGAVALHDEVERIDVLEISRAVVEAAPLFAEHNRGALGEGLPGLLDANDGHGRVVVILGDGRRTLRESPATYDVVTMEPLLPDSPFGVHLYTAEAYDDVKRALKPGGIACQWVPPHALEPRTFDAVLHAFNVSFAWSAVWVSGTQAILVGAERAPTLDARRVPATGPCAIELQSLSLESAVAVAAGCVERFRRDASAIGPSLSDLDPWIAYRPRRAGAILLADLPLNLAALLQRDVDGTEAERPLGYGDHARTFAARARRAARLAWARAECEARGVDPGGESDLDAALAEARRVAAGEQELDDLMLEIAFVRDLRAGVAALAADPSREAALAALEPLTRAAQARKERADVHAYVAAALDRVGSPAAAKALDAALERCPRLAETDAGRRARELGLSPDSWERAVASARAASERNRP